MRTPGPCSVSTALPIVAPALSVSTAVAVSGLDVGDCAGGTVASAGVQASAVARPAAASEWIRMWSPSYRVSGGVSVVNWSPSSAQGTILRLIREEEYGRERRQG